MINKITLITPFFPGVSFYMPWVRQPPDWC
jgi:hypothetical protein